MHFYPQFLICCLRHHFTAIQWRHSALVRHQMVQRISPEFLSNGQALAQVRSSPHRHQTGQWRRNACDKVRLADIERYTRCYHSSHTSCQCTCQTVSYHLPSYTPQHRPYSSCSAHNTTPCCSGPSDCQWYSTCGWVCKHIHTFYNAFVTHHVMVRT